MKYLLLTALLIFSSKALAQYGLGTPNRTMQQLGVQTTARGIVHYASGPPNTVITWRAVKDTSAYLWCDTLTSRLYNWNHTANKWYTVGVFDSNTLPPATTTSGPATIDNRQAFWYNTSSNTLYFYDRTGSVWATLGGGGGGSDNWGTQVVETDATLTGDGTTGDEIGIAQQGATSGQVLKWNGSAWLPATDNAGGAGAWGTITGTLADQTDLQSALNAKANSSHTHAPGDITQAGATSGQVLKWNGAAWAPANDTDTNTDAQTLSFSEPNLSISGGNSVDLSGLTPTAEELQDATGAMVSGNTETLIAVTYQDADGTIDFDVTPTLSSYTNDAGFLTGNQTVTLSGDITGSGTTAITTAIATGAVAADELASTAVTPGSYTLSSITVDSDGRITAASSGTPPDGTETSVTAGTGISVTGTGASGTPYVVSNTGDLSASNELQTISNTGASTTHTATLSNSGGSLQLAEGTGIGLATTGTTLDGIVTVTNTGDTDGSDDITASSSAGGDLSGAFSNLQIGTGVVGPTEMASTAVTPGSYTAANITVDADGRITAASNGTGGATGHTVKDDGSSMTQRAGLNFVSTSTASAALTDDGANDETEVRITVPTDGITATEIAADAVGASELQPTAVGAGSYTMASITVDADGRITAASNGTEVDGSTTNEAWTISDGTNSEVINNQTVTFAEGGIMATLYDPGTNTLTISATEVDGSTTNEIQDLSLGGNTLSLTGDASTVDLSGYLDNTDAQGLTITGSAAPFTLDISGGSDVSIDAGTGITLSETPANTLVVTNSAPDQTVSITDGGGVAVSGTYPSFTVTATDQTISNEGSLTVGAGSGTTSIINSNTSGSTGVTVTAGIGLSISETGNTITLTNTGDTNDADDLTTGTTFSGDVSGTYNAIEIGAGVVGATEIASTTVTPGSYTLASVTVDADGRITAASNGSASGGHTIRDNGTGETQRAALNFISTSTVTAAVADDAGNDESEVTMSIPTDGITATEIAAGAVGTSEIANGTVAYADIQNVSATDKVLGRSTAGAGSIEEIAMTAAGRALIDDASATDQRTTLGLGTIATQNAATVSISGGSITGITDLAIADGGTGASTTGDARNNLGAASSGANTDISSIELVNTGLTIDDTDGSHQLYIIPGSNLTADRTLTVTTGDADRTLTMTGDASVSGTHTGTSSGTNTGDQTITLTGDVTGSGAGSFAATISTGAVAADELASTAVTPGSYTLSSITVDADGRITAASNGTGGGTNYQTLRDDGSDATQQANANFVSTSDVAFTLANDGGNSETEITADIPAGAVDYAEIQNVSATDRLLGRSTAGAGTIEEIACTAAGRAILDDADASAQRTTLGLGTIATQAANSVSITGGSITGITDLAVADGGTGASDASTARSNLSAAQSGANTDITSVVLNNIGLVIKDSDASHNLTITTGSNLTGAHTLTINPGDADRTLTLGGSATISGGTHSGTNTGDQTITLTGDVTGTGSGSFAATIANDAVTNAKAANMATSTIKGRTTAGTGDPEDLTAAQAAAIVQSSVDHGSIAGLGDDDHTQYTLLAGRSGGQTFTGGTASGDDITLRSTTNATKGDIIVNDQGGNVIIGGAATATEVRFMEPSGSGTNYTALKAGASTGNPTFTLPAADGTNGQAITTNGLGVLSFTTVGGGSPSVISPSQITSTQNDYTPTGWADATLVRVSGNSSFQKITGFGAETSGEIKTIVNVGSYCLYIAPEHTGSSAANRVSYQEEIVVWPGSSCQIYYDGTLSRWSILTSPSPEYRVPKRSVYYDMPVAKLMTAASADTEMDLFGSITLTNGAPTGTTVPFAFWNMNSGSSTSGGAGIFYPNEIEDMAWIGGSHIVAKTFIRSTATLGDGTNNYYYFLRIASNPSSGFFTQNNSVGIYYRYSDNSGKFWLRSTNSIGTSTETDSGITYAVDTDYELAVSLNYAANEATFWINGVVVGRITTNLPSGVAVGPSQQLEKTAGSSARSVKCYRFIGAAIAP